MKIAGADGREMMTIASIERDGRDLVLKGKIFGTMPMTARVPPEELRQGLQLLDWRTRLYLLTVPFRRRR